MVLMGEVSTDCTVRKDNILPYCCDCLFVYLRMIIICYLRGMLYREYSNQLIERVMREKKVCSQYDTDPPPPYTFATTATFLCLPRRTPPPPPLLT